jgi:hypothetical protein
VLAKSVAERLNLCAQDAGESREDRYRREETQGNRGSNKRGAARITVRLTGRRLWGRAAWANVLRSAKDFHGKMFFYADGWRLRGKSPGRSSLRDCRVMFALIVCGISFGGAPILAQEAGGPNIDNLHIVPGSSPVDLSIPHWQDGCENRCCASNSFYYLCVIPRGLEPAVQHDILEVEEKG